MVTICRGGPPCQGASPLGTKAIGFAGPVQRDAGVWKGPFCKKIRNDKGYWDQVEVYVKEHTEADFSHSVCPDCMKTHYPDLKVDAKVDS